MKSIITVKKRACTRLYIYITNTQCNLKEREGVGERGRKEFEKTKEREEGKEVKLVMLATVFKVDTETT